MLYKKYKKFIFDLDGTIYKGNLFIEGAIETINTIKTFADKILFVSNKTTEMPDDYYEFLVNGGARICKEDIITSTMVIGKFLQANFSGKKFFSISEEKFIQYLISLGLYFTESPNQIEIVIVTLDRGFNYKKLEIAAKALENSARFFAANIDDTCPVENGEITDAGSIISALEKRTHRKLEMHFGKPSFFMQNFIKEKFNNDLSSTILIGDRKATDIKMANQMKIDSALVNTGVRNFELDNIDYSPTYNLNSISDLLK
jgi:HAD superfamily hydrolase (TIGR01450 family)